MHRVGLLEILMVGFALFLGIFLVTRHAPQVAGQVATASEQPTPAPGIPHHSAPDTPLQPAPDTPLQSAPDIPLHLEKAGFPANLSGMKGKVVVLDFWATWCGPCRMSIPQLEAIYQKYKSHGLKVIGISVDDKNTRDKVPAVKKQIGFTYPVTYAEDIKDIREKYVFDSIPTLVVIDKKGFIRISQEGYDPQSDLDAKIAGFLKE